MLEYQNSLKNTAIKTLTENAQDISAFYKGCCLVDALTIVQGIAFIGQGAILAGSGGTATFTLVGSGVGAGGSVITIPVTVVGVIEVVLGIDIGVVATINLGEHLYYLMQESNSGENRNTKEPTSTNQMQQQINRGQAPKGVSRVDSAEPNIPNSQPHIHFGENEAALNIDGTWHDAGKPLPNITAKIAKWILENGWNLPIK